MFDYSALHTELKSVVISTVLSVKRPIHSGGGGDSHIKGAGMLVGNVERGPSFFLTPK